ncbi:uncharacterized protein LOC128178403 [Crassostrea angulata]|uniref:uncharacterized protein LOC128178403 n=1 Tax=Magallana angulata TaxID=2784310 RepID=UPI0022B0BA7F|nr:uncharacterized protein LOC128178403 [Crassostrea angulata]
MTRLLVFICFIGLASCCQRKGEIITCAELPPPTRLEGAKILIVARVSEKTIDLRQKNKLLVQHTDLNCDRIQAKASTKVFLGDKMCSFDSKESRSRENVHHNAHSRNDGHCLNQDHLEYETFFQTPLG